MGSDLKNGIGGSVDDPLSGFQLFRTIVPDHIGAGIRQIAQNAPSGLALKFIQYLFGKAMRIGGQRVGRYHARNLPVPDGRILAHGGFRQSCDCPRGCRRLRQIIHAVKISQSRLQQIRDGEFRRTGAGAKGIHPHIPEGRRVRHLSDAAGIQYDQKNPFHIALPGKNSQLPAAVSARQTYLI